MSEINDSNDNSEFPELAAWELAIVEVFCRGAAMIGLRKSIGMVYGALYCAETPLAIVDLQRKLRLSRGACVEAVQLLRRFGAVRLVLKIGERKDFYEAETDLKRCIAGTCREMLAPAVEKASARLDHAETLALGNVAKSKIENLRAAKNLLEALVPALEKIIE